MVNALLETGQVDEKVFAHKLGESLGLPVWEGEIPPIPAPLREKFPARIALRHRLLPGVRDVIERIGAAFALLHALKTEPTALVRLLDTLAEFAGVPVEQRWWAATR